MIKSVFSLLTITVFGIIILTGCGMMPPSALPYTVFPTLMAMASVVIGFGMARENHKKEHKNWGSHDIR